MQEGRVLVIGPGALGVLIAARLAAAGHTVFVAKRPGKRIDYPPKWEAIDEEGHSVFGKITTVGEGWEARGRVDAIVLTPKCDDAPNALRRWMEALDTHGAVIALQNGLIGDELVPIARDHLVECTVAFPATLLGPGRSEQTGPGAFILGAWPDGRMEAATPVVLAASIMAVVETTRVSRNMTGIKWTKLLINSAITGLGAMTGVELGELFAKKEGRDAAIAIVTEGYRAALASGIAFEKVAGFHPKMVSITAPTAFMRVWQHRRAHAVLKVFGMKYKRQRSSSLQSLDRGQRTEVHHLNGRIIREAKKHRLNAAVNEAVVAAVQRIEDGHEPPSIETLDALPTLR